jgi:hypothetical protein
MIHLKYKKFYYYYCYSYHCLHDQSERTSITTTTTTLLLLLQYSGCHSLCWLAGVFQPAVSSPHKQHFKTRPHFLHFKVHFKLRSIILFSENFRVNFGILSFFDIHTLRNYLSTLVQNVTTTDVVP